jgi:hypothetical protein
MFHPRKGVGRSGRRKGKRCKSGKKGENNGQEREMPGKRHKITSLGTDALPMIRLSYRTGDGFFSVKILIFIFHFPGEKKGKNL